MEVSRTWDVVGNLELRESHWVVMLGGVVVIEGLICLGDLVGRFGRWW